MSALLVAHLVSVSAYAGFQWTVRALVYPQMAQVPPAAFVAYEREHGRRISPVVGVLFAATALTALSLCVRRPAGVPPAAALASAALVGVALATTGLLAVPLHRRLGRGWDQHAHRQLLRVDSIRVAAATANVMLVGVLAVRA